MRFLSLIFIKIVKEEKDDSTIIITVIGIKEQRLLPLLLVIPHKPAYANTEL